jgi:hypothetical protein
MKSLKSLFTVLFITTNFAYAGITEEVNRLSSLAMGHDVVAVKKSKNLEELFKNFAEVDYGEFESDFFEYKEIDKMSFGDEINYGFTSPKSAELMGEFAESQFEELLENLENNDPETLKLKARVYDLKKEWAPSIKRLAQYGAKFGYDGHGPGYCGVSFVRLLIIDPKTNKVYTINLSQSGPC